MTIEAIKESTHAEPFQPFHLRLADSKTVKVAHPDYIAFGPKGRTVVVYGADDSFRVLDVMLITELEMPARPPRR